MMMQAIGDSLAILETIHRYPLLSRTDDVYAEALGAVLPVFRNSLFADSVTLAAIPHLSTTTSSSLHRGTLGEPILLEEVFTELAAEISRLNKETAALQSQLDQRDRGMLALPDYSTALALVKDQYSLEKAKLGSVDLVRQCQVAKSEAEKVRNEVTTGD